VDLQIKRAAKPLVRSRESKRGRKKVPKAPDRDLRLDEATACRIVTEHSQGAKKWSQDLGMNNRQGKQKSRCSFFLGS
jgi:hypothetical protein